MILMTNSGSSNKEMQKRRQKETSTNPFGLTVEENYSLFTSYKKLATEHFGW
jgi:hypothetical protein